MDSDWYALMGSYEAFKFVMCPELCEIGVKEYRWIERSVARTLKKGLDVGGNPRGQKIISDYPGGGAFR